MLSVILTIIATFFVSTLLGYAIHWSLHQSWAGRFNKSHMTHHLTLYPPNDFVSETYRNAGSDNTVKTFAILTFPFILIPILLWFLGYIGLINLAIILFVMGIMAFLHDSLHDAFHIKNHFLYSIPVFNRFFIKWVKLHYLHHVNMQTNFGIFIFHWDHIFKTYWNMDK